MNLKSDFRSDLLSAGLLTKPMQDNVLHNFMIIFLDVLSFLRDRSFLQQKKSLMVRQREPFFVCYNSNKNIEAECVIFQMIVSVYWNSNPIDRKILSFS